MVLALLYHQQFSSVGLLLLLLLCVQPSQPNPAHRSTDTHPEGRIQYKLSDVVSRRQNEEGLLRGKTRGERQKRQVFKPTNASDNHASSGSRGSSPTSGKGDGTEGWFSSLGKVLGSSGAYNMTEGGGGLGESRGGEGLFNSSGNSTSASKATTSGELGGIKNDTGDSSLSSGSSTSLPTGQDQPSGSEAGNVMSNLLGSVGASNSSATNTSDSGLGGGGLGGIVGGMVNSSGPADGSDYQDNTTCGFLNVCFPGYCDNGGTCVFNMTTCKITCLCPPPFNDSELYDQNFCKPRGTSPPQSSSPPTNGSGEDGAVTSGGVPCFVNMCNNGYECQHGGTCYFNTTTCLVRCLCPPPYDDSDLYDQQTCSLLPTPPSSSPMTTSTTTTTTTKSSAGLTTTLRPFSERQCKIRPCQHGYCDSGYCKCDPGWKGIFCDQACTKNCSNNGRCLHIIRNGTQMCNCNRPWTGEFCTNLIPGPPENDQSLVYWLGGSFGVGVVLVLLTGAIFMFCVWRKRLAFALKIVYYFLPYEDNDGRVYDALVSYVLEDADENFVYSDLRAKLEIEMGFQLCLHQRDFPIGGTITDNILDGLENSRRFILVITPAYLRNEWAEFEFQRAFHEMLKRKIRIIPIILEDISTYPEDFLNPTLKTILESVTPLKYPGSQADERKLLKFWKKVKLCMPKRKSFDEPDRPALLDNEGAVGDATNLATNNNQVLVTAENGGHANVPVDMDVLGIYPRIAANNCQDLNPNQHERCGYEVVNVSGVVLTADLVNEQSV